MKTMLLAVQVDDDRAERLAEVGANIGGFEVIASATVQDSRDKMFLRSPVAVLTTDDGVEVETFQSGITLISYVSDESLSTQASLNLAPILEVLAGVSIGYRA